MVWIDENNSKADSTRINYYTDLNEKKIINEVFWNYFFFVTKIFVTEIFSEIQWSFIQLFD